MNTTVAQFVSSYGNFTLLVAIPVICFVIGERLFARRLAQKNFLIDSSTGPIEPTSSLSQSIGAPFAAASGGTTVVGVGICATFGWLPAYLWAIIVSTFAGGLFACASYWLVRQYPTRGASEIIAALLGRSSLSLFYIVLGILLCLLAPMLALAAGELLAANSGASLAVLLTLIIVAVSSLFPRIQVAVPVICIAASIAAISMSDEWGFGMQGYVSFNVGDHTSVLPARAMWILVVAVLCGWLAERSRRNGGIASMIGSTASIGLLLVIGSALIGLMLVNPQIMAPAFNTEGQRMLMLPLLFVFMTGGAVNAFHAFVNDPESDTFRGNGLQIAYARAALDGLLAVSVILITATIGANTEQWQASVGTIDSQSPIHLWLAQFAIGISLLAPELGIDSVFARDLVSFVMILATLSALERCFRVLHYLMSEVVASTPVNRVPLARRWVYLVAAVFACALLIKSYGIGYNLWPIMGTASHIFTGTILGVVIINLKRKGKSSSIALLVCSLLWVAVLAACAFSVYVWSVESRFVYLIPWAALFFIGSALATRLLWRLSKVEKNDKALQHNTITQEIPSHST